MKNSEKFQTAEERGQAFDEYCNSRICNDCPAWDRDDSGNCRFAWLDLDAEEEEKPLPCPFCGFNTVVTSHDTVRHANDYCIECTNCNYRSEEKYQRDSAIADHNRVARAVIEAAKKEAE